MAKKRFVSEPIDPARSSGDVAAMARGEPGPPTSFEWRGKRFSVARVVGTRKGMGEDRGDVYVRRHYFDIETDSGERMTIYFERNPLRRGARKPRWWLYTIEE